MTLVEWIAKGYCIVGTYYVDTVTYYESVTYEELNTDWIISDVTS